MIRIAHEIRPVVQAAVRQGWRLSLCKSGHLRLESPQGRSVYTAGTPSDVRSRRNFTAELRRAGCKI